MKNLSLLALLLVLAAHAARAEFSVDFEAGQAFPARLDVRIPSDDGTRISLTDDLDAENPSVSRVRLTWRAGRHSLAALAAPLEIDSKGTIDQDVRFDDAVFPAGTDLKSTYRFDSYRLVYRYLCYTSAAWRIELGGAAKVRDAEIELRGGGLADSDKNTGLVPLASFLVQWTVAPKFHLVADGEALASPQGRAEDVLFALAYDMRDDIVARAGYRILDGGADNDDVYTFALVHYAVVSLGLSF